MYRLFVPAALAFIFAACNGTTAGTTLQGTGFSPNGAVVVLDLLPDGGLSLNAGQLDVASSTPAIVDCQYIDADFPDSGRFLGEVSLHLQNADGPIAPGSFPIGRDRSDGGLSVLLLLIGATTPTSSGGIEIGDASDGTLLLTQVGSRWTGSFEATVVEDSRVISIAGTFDTSIVCGAPD